MMKCSVLSKHHPLILDHTIEEDFMWLDVFKNDPQSSLKMLFKLVHIFVQGVVILKDVSFFRCNAGPV